MAVSYPLPCSSQCWASLGCSGSTGQSLHKGPWWDKGSHQRVPCSILFCWRIISCTLLFLSAGFGLTTEVDISPNAWLLMSSFPLSYLIFKIPGAICMHSAIYFHSAEGEKKKVAKVNSYLTDFANCWTTGNCSVNVRQVLKQENVHRKWAEYSCTKDFACNLQD